MRLITFITRLGSPNSPVKCNNGTTYKPLVQAKITFRYLQMRTNLVHFKEFLSTLQY